MLYFLMFFFLGDRAHVYISVYFYYKKTNDKYIFVNLIFVFLIINIFLYFFRSVECLDECPK